MCYSSLSLKVFKQQLKLIFLDSDEHCLARVVVTLHFCSSGAI